MDVLFDVYPRGQSPQVSIGFLLECFILQIKVIIKCQLSISQMNTACTAKITSIPQWSISVILTVCLNDMAS